MTVVTLEAGSFSLCLSSLFLQYWALSPTTVSKGNGPYGIHSSLLIIEIPDKLSRGPKFWRNYSSVFEANLAVFLTRLSTSPSPLFPWVLLLQGPTLHETSAYKQVKRHTSKQNSMKTIAGKNSFWNPCIPVHLLCI